eukprot:3492433-Pleurochrysis_carterae.AAC.1
MDRNCTSQRSYKINNAENVQNRHTDMLSIRVLAGVRTRFGVHARVERWYLLLQPSAPDRDKQDTAMLMANASRA